MFTLIQVSCSHSDKIIKNIDNDFGTTKAQMTLNKEAEGLKGLCGFEIGKTTIKDLGNKIDRIPLNSSVEFTETIDHHGKKINNGCLKELSKTVKKYSPHDSKFNLSIVFFKDVVIAINSNNFPIEIKNEFIRKFGEGKGHLKCFLEEKWDDAANKYIIYKEIRENRTWENNKLIAECTYDVDSTYLFTAPYAKSSISMHDNTSLYNEYLKELDRTDKNPPKKSDSKRVKEMNDIRTSLLIQKSNEEDYNNKLKLRYGAKYASLIKQGRLEIGMTKEMCIEAFGQPIHRSLITDANGKRELLMFKHSGTLYTLDFDKNEKIISIEKN